jgi:ligand-binding sensor domain-containing protein
MQQKNGTFWLGSKPNGLYRLTESSDGVFKIENFVGTDLISHDIYDIKEDGRGRLWIATQYGGLHLLVHPQTEQPHFLNHKNAFKNFPKNAMLMRRIMIVNDTTLLATTTKGFLVLDDINVDPRKMTFNLHCRESKRA